MAVLAPDRALPVVLEARAPESRSLSARRLTGWLSTAGRTPAQHRQQPRRVVIISLVLPPERSPSHRLVSGYSYWSASRTRRRAARRAGRIAATMPAITDTITNVISARSEEH